MSASINADQNPALKDGSLWPQINTHAYLTLRRFLVTAFLVTLAATTWVCKAAHLGAHWATTFQAACSHHGALTNGLHLAILAVVTLTECCALKELSHLVHSMLRGRAGAGCFNVAVAIFATLLRGGYLVLGWRALSSVECLSTLTQAAQAERSAALVLLLIVTFVDTAELTKQIRYALAWRGRRPNQLKA